MKLLYSIVLILFAFDSSSQNSVVTGMVSSGGFPVQFASVKNLEKSLGVSDSTGLYSIKNLNAGKYSFRVHAVGYHVLTKTVQVGSNDTLRLDFDLSPSSSSLNEVVVSGTLKEVSRLESPVPVEVYSPAFFKKNPTPSIFEALQNVNGVRPQINCNVCNTGDIHINGLEGPYTMVMIDGMPIVSSLSTVYGLSGIPNSLIERVEVVKGPASSLYGSEAVGGLINIITKKPSTAPVFSADVLSTTWAEVNTDLGFKFQAGKASVLTGLNYFNYQNPVDNNRDNFTDVTQQHRMSLFQKWVFKRKDDRLFSLAGRYFYEDRWGGEMNWNREFRGGDVIYGESIYTNRYELLGQYQLPVKEKLLFAFSYNKHEQNSVYGKTTFLADQQIAFGQLTLDKKLSRHDLLVGAALRYTLYDDNTTVTGGGLYQPDKVWLPGVFLQDDISLHERHNLLLGARFDYNSSHGKIFTPRLAYKWEVNGANILRLNAGTGFRVVNLFTEDHAALTGARDVVVIDDLRPEKSYNANLNYIRKLFTKNDNPVNLEFTAWYTHFTNRIVADYETDVNKIIYDNLSGYAVSRGLSANLDMSLNKGIKVLAGITLMDVYTVDKSLGQSIKKRQMLTEPWMGTWALTVPLKKLNLSFDYTGNIYGQMNLPTLGESDPRRKTSPVWSLQNIQLTYTVKKFEVYGGIKNLLNWTPNRNNPFIIARSNDPFDKNPEIDNPYALTFDPTYVYAPNQGMRGFLGVRVNIRK